MERLREFVAAPVSPGHGTGASVRDFAGTKRVGDAIRDTRLGYAAHRVKLVDELFGGATSEGDEDKALGLIVSSERSSEMTLMVNTLTWSGLDDELDKPDLDLIARRLSDLLDSEMYRIRHVLERAFQGETMKLSGERDLDLTRAAARIPVEIRQEIVDELIDRRDEVLDGMALMALRGLASNQRELKLLLDFIQLTGLHRPADLASLTWELFYTDRICSQIERGEFRLLLQSLPDLVDATLPGVRRGAFLDMLQRWDPAFRAMDELVKSVGSERQKADVRNFMDRRRLFMDNFPPVLTPPGPFASAIQTILNALNGVTGNFQDLVAAVQAAVQTISDVSVPNLFRSTGDDEAVAAANGLISQDLLGPLPFDYKRELINRILEGSDIVPAVVDEEEQTVNKILAETKRRSVAEFLQLSVGITWDRLYGHIDGDEYDDLLQLFAF